MSNKPLVYKFGGASVKDANAVKNLASIIKKSGIANNLIIVVSAMGKMTNAFEELVNISQSVSDFSSHLNEIKEFHTKIIIDLFGNDSSALSDFEEQAQLLEAILKQAHKMRMSYDYAYDQIVSFGELFSTKIISNYLNSISITSEWIDARRCILTDSTHRNAVVNFDYSTVFSKQNFNQHIDSKIIITQGFIGSNSDGNTTTLGREGSDYSAAILATSMDAESVTIWKDVDGVLNGDPKKINSPIKYDKLSYEEIIEMSYYGATVIHPKTLKPLANKKIPLFVRSFLKPNQEGTEIGLSDNRELSPAIIIRENQSLISFRKKDLSFMEEKNIENLINEISDLNLKMNLVQKSALNFSIVTDFDENKILKLHEQVIEEYLMHYNSNLKLITIKNYKSLEIPNEIECSEVLLEQKTRKNIQYLVK